MTDTSSTDQLLTEPASATADTAKPLTLDTAAIDPAAVHDQAAALDPAKVKPPKAKVAKRKRAPKAKRAKASEKALAANADNHRTAKAVATVKLNHAASARAAGRLDYEAALLHEVDGFAQLPEGASLDLRLADGGEFIAGAIVGVCRDIRPASQGFTYAKDVDIGPDGDPVRVSEAWLIAGSGEAARCAVGPLSAGGGYHAKIPAGHLKF